MTAFISLPTELLDQIIASIPTPDLQALRTSCRTFRHLMIPHVLSTIAINSTNSPRTRSQLSALADPRNVTHHSAAAVTKTLVVTFGSQDEGDLSDIKTLLIPAIAVLAACKRIVIGTAPRKIITSPQKHHQFSPWVISSLPGVLASLPSLRDLEIHYPAGFRETVDLSAVKGLQRLKLSISQGMMAHPKVFAAFEASVAAASGPELVALDIYISVHSGVVRSDLATLFSRCHPSLRLQELRLDGVILNGLSTAIPFLSRLQRIHLGPKVYGDQDKFFEALGTAGVRLRAVDTAVTTKGLVEYLSSYSGLQEVVLRPLQEQGQGSIADVAGVMKAQARSLRALDVMVSKNDGWVYSDEAAEWVLGCRGLVKLSIAVSVGHVAQLMADVATLPDFQTLVIDCAVPTQEARFGAGVQAVEAAARTIRIKIKEFVPPQQSSKMRVIRMRWGGREEFRRVRTEAGERFVWGGVGKDGVWREAGGGQFVDRFGEVRRTGEVIWGRFNSQLAGI